MKKKVLLMAVIFGAAITAASFNFGNNHALATVPGNNSGISVDVSGASFGNQQSDRSYVSADATYIVFDSSASTLVASDTNAKNDVFIRNRATNTTSRVSISSLGVQSDRPSMANAVSETGRYVLFTSQATNLIDNSTISDTYAQLYIRDTMNSTTTILSENASSALANGNTAGLDVSSDGRFVLFSSTATNLGPTITNTGYSNIFVLDRDSDTFTLVNAPASGSLYNIQTSYAQMNCDGSLIVFESGADNLTIPATTPSGHNDVFLADRRDGYKVTAITAAANSAALRAEISCNGNYIGFVSKASNLDSNLTDTSMNEYHAYVYDRIDDTFLVVDQSSSNITANTGVMYGLSGTMELKISDTGLAAFKSPATNLVGAATSGVDNIYIRNLKTGTTELISRDNGGSEANSYRSSATNLVSGDTNGYPDIFASETGY
jgi:hypothetical protein